MTRLAQGRADEAKELLEQALDGERSVGYISITLRASIYLALALHQTDRDAAATMLRDAGETARAQGFKGLEAEALICEALMAQSATEIDRPTIVDHLRDCIAITTENGARPLLLKAQSLLDRFSAASSSREVG
jgi:hypothetical protein